MDMIKIVPDFISSLVGQSFVLDLIVFLACFFILMWAAGMLVTNLKKIANYLRLSNYVIAFILMGFITSIPEFFLGVTSALNKVPIYSLGNILGANLADIGLVLGIGVILIQSLRIKKKVAKEDAIYMLIVAVLPLILISDGLLSRPDGLVLIGFFAFYVTRLIYQRQRSKVERKEVSKWEMFGHALTFLVSIYFLFFSSQVMINSGLSISKQLNFPLILIGIFSAIGTTLPELSFTLKSIFRYRGEMTLGNVIGSVVVNSSLILGIVAMIHPIVLANVALVILSAVFLIISLVLFLIFSRTDEELNLKEGLILFFLYIIFIILATGIGR